MIANAGFLEFFIPLCVLGVRAGINRYPSWHHPGLAERVHRRAWIVQDGAARRRNRRLDRLMRGLDRRAGLLAAAASLLPSASCAGPWPWRRQVFGGSGNMDRPCRTSLSASYCGLDSACRCRTYACRRGTANGTDIHSVRTVSRIRPCGDACASAGGSRSSDFPRCGLISGSSPAASRRARFPWR